METLNPAAIVGSVCVLPLLAALGVVRLWELFKALV